MQQQFRSRTYPKIRAKALRAVQLETIQVIPPDQPPDALVTIQERSLRIFGLRIGLGRTVIFDLEAERNHSSL